MMMSLVISQGTKAILKKVITQVAVMSTTKILVNSITRQYDKGKKYK